MTSRVDRGFVLESFSHPVAIEGYSRAVAEIGLWESEKLFFRRHLPVEGLLLDLGCGAGRTTFALRGLGYGKIVGLDLTPVLVREAMGHAARSGVSIPFRVGDACCLPFPDRTFAGCLFSFNGLMGIPRRAERVRALAEVRRVLAPGGVFVFTTHDRDAAVEWRAEWEAERGRWREGRQDPRLHEFGDKVFEDAGREYFIHIPARKEVLEGLAEAGLEWIEDAWRPALAAEPEAVTRASVDCRFWAARRTA